MDFSVLFLVIEKALRGLYLKELKYTSSTTKKSFIFMGLCLIICSTRREMLVKYKSLLFKAIILL